MISFKGAGCLYIVKGMMNAEQYTKVLETHLIPHLQDWFPDGNCVYMQDGAPCHMANVIKDYFDGIGMEVLPWPGNSPDMNQIEGIWYNLKDKVNKVTITNKRDLIVPFYVNFTFRARLSWIVNGII